jgi:hypothetical protein
MALAAFLAAREIRNDRNDQFATPKGSRGFECLYRHHQACRTKCGDFFGGMPWSGGKNIVRNQWRLLAT